MIQRKRQRQIGLLLLAILLPASMLVVLAARVLRQDSELNDKRIAEERLLRTDQLRRELTARLEAIKLQELNRLLGAAHPELPIRPADSSLVLVSPLAGQHFVLPWSTSVGQPHGISPNVAGRLQRGEDLEFSDKDLEGAVNVYRDALANAASQAETCQADLHLARALIKTRHRDDARTVYQPMLSQCLTVADADGIALSLYAAERLLRLGLDESSASRFLLADADLRFKSPLEISFLNALLPLITGEGADRARLRLQSEIDTRRDIAALFNDFPKVLARMEPSREQMPNSTVWLAYGNKPWLITLTGSTKPVPPLVLVVQADNLATPGAHLANMGTAVGERVGDAFPALRVVWDYDLPQRPKVPTLEYVGGIAVIVALAVLIGFLLLRDVNREVQVAEMREQFVASVSHELKTPLTVIRMYAEMLMNGHIKDAHARDYHQTIVNESDRLKHLVNNVLEFSKLEHAPVCYGLQPASLAQIVRSAAAAVEYQLARDGFVLDVLIDEGIPNVPVDTAALEHAIINLLTNARKYSGDSRRIELILKGDSGEALIQVRDWGLGIAPEHHTRIFEKFYRVRSVATDAVTGTGLGLTLVSRIVQAHGGTVHVSSALGQGSTFTIHLPLQALTRKAEITV
jgi:signal transduction histidine kinase